MYDNVEKLLNQVQLVSKKLKEQRDAKRKRGEDFNIFEELGLSSDEVHLHSKFLANLLDPNGSHGQGDKFLTAFLQMLPKGKSRSAFSLNTDNTKVEVEKAIGRVEETTGGRLDLCITDGEHQIIIENKIYAGDQKHQMLRYWNYAKDNSKSGDSFVLIYLTLDGRDPSKGSSDGIAKEKIICLSYKYDIRNWLERCVEISAKAPLVRETINQYINTIDILTNNDMSENKELLDIMGKEEYIDAVYDIAWNKDTLVDYIINEKFFPKLISKVKEKGLSLGEHSEGWIGESAEWAFAKFSKPEWKYLEILFQFDNTRLRKLCFGFVAKQGYEISNIPNWEKIKGAFMASYTINRWYIYKEFKGDQSWDNPLAIKNLLNGKTLKDFEDMFDEALACVKGLDI